MTFYVAKIILIVGRNEYIDEQGSPVGLIAYNFLSYKFHIDSKTKSFTVDYKIEFSMFDMS